LRQCDGLQNAKLSLNPHSQAHAILFCSIGASKHNKIVHVDNLFLVVMLMQPHHVVHMHTRM
jgi:hypothetical protein